MRRSPRTAIQAPASAAASVAQLVASFTGGDTQQNTLAAVSATVTVTGGTASYTYATSLVDPLGVDRAGLLSGATTANPSFTPDITGGPGIWVLRSTVTDSDGRVALAARSITVGLSAGGAIWLLARDILSDGVSAATPSSSLITWGGLVFGAPNAGVAVDAGDLVLTPPGSSTLNSSSRTAPLVTASLTDLVGLSSLDSRQVLILLDIESYPLSANGEGVYVGLENTANPLSSGSPGRGVIGGHQIFTTLRAASTIAHDSTGFATVNSDATAASVAGVACLIGGGSVNVFTSTSLYADAAAALSTAFKQNGGMRPSNTPVALNRLLLAAVKSSAGTGASCRIARLRVYIR